MLDRKFITVFSLLVGFVLIIEISGKEKDTTTLYDMKIIPSVYTTLCMAKHSYNENFIEGERVFFDSEKALIKEIFGKHNDIAYLFLTIQLIAIFCFCLFLAYDFFTYLKFSETWAQTFIQNIYLLMVGLLKFIGIIALIIDIPLAFNKKKSQDYPI